MSGRWPFAALCDQMCVDVLSPAWEVRHGAAVALREVLRSHAGSAGVDAQILAEPSGVLLLFLSSCISCATVFKSPTVRPLRKLLKGRKQALCFTLPQCMHHMWLDLETTLETAPKDARPILQAAVIPHFRLSSGIGEI